MNKYTLFKMTIFVATCFGFLPQSLASQSLVVSNLDSCLNVREPQTRRYLNQCLPIGTNVQWTGRTEGGYYVVTIPNSQFSSQEVLLYSQYLSPASGSTADSIDNVSPIEEAGNNPEAPTSTVVDATPVTPSTSIPTPAPQVSTSFPRNGSESQRRAWVRENLKSSIRTHGQQMLNTVPSDIGQYCSNYSRLNQNQRVDFWATLMTEMVRYESNFQTHLTHRESFRDSTGNYVISTGLFQISRESSRAYGCPINGQSDLMDPNKNMDCSVRILNRWVGRDRVITNGRNRGGGRYWAVLRSSTSYGRNALSSMRNATRSYCQNANAATTTIAESDSDSGAQH